LRLWPHKVGAMKKWFFILALLSCSADAPAAEKAPLPDVWGRELAVPTRRIVNGYYLRDRKDGDYVVTYTHHSADPETGNLQVGGDWSRLDFFEGKTTPITSAQQDEIRLTYPAPQMRVQSRGGVWLFLPGEMQVKPWSRELKGAGCWVNYAGSLVLRDKAEQVVKHKVVLRLLDAPERREYWNLCQSRRNTVDESHYDARVDALSFVLYPLADGTFLAEGSASPFLIRFRPDLTSPFIDTHPNLFLVDSDEIDRVVKGSYTAAGDFSVQAANDALYKYAMELKAAKASQQLKAGAK
jgi:hypothetical protein